MPVARASEGRLAVMEELLAKLPYITSPTDLCESLQGAGAAPCSVLLCRASKHSQQTVEWQSCLEAALKAREYAWEQLHSGPSWQAVAPVHREAYGVAGILVAVAIFLSGGPNSLEKAVYNLDLVALMAGGKFQEAANQFVEVMERHARVEEAIAKSTIPDAIQHVPDITTTSIPDPETSTSTPINPERLQQGPVIKKAKLGVTKGEGNNPIRKGDDVRRIRCPPLDVFQREYMETATPVILTGVMDGWPAMGHQGHRSGNARDWSNASYLRRIAGRRTVPVEVGGCYTAEGWRQELMTVGDFIDRYIEVIPQETSPTEESSKSTLRMEAGVVAGDGKGENGEEQMATNRRLDGATDGVDGRRGTAYLAQHQLFDQIPPLRRDVITPDYCALMLADEEDEAGAESVAINAWFGPGGTVSPLHNDPFHNLLAQVVGRKRVLLVDRKFSSSVYPRPGLMSNTSEVDAANPDLCTHPLFQNVMPLVECELRRGEMLYIPPLFWHHIESLEVSFSVSFWWGKRRAL